MEFANLNTSFLSQIVIVSLPAVLGLFYLQLDEKRALFLLIVSAFLLRIIFINVDPFLHNWDERYHALVAKHLIEFPFKPMLWLEHILGYDYEAWCCNHIWLHKQPLFLWLMAGSMAIFDETICFMRLPSAILGTLTVFFTYEISKAWTSRIDFAYMCALFLCFSFFHLELISGRIGLDHNDIAFAFFINGSFWGFLKYIKSNRKIIWSLIIGVFVGCAILVKWLTAFLIFGGWIIYILQKKELRNKLRSYGDVFLSLTTSILVALPWQLYIRKTYPTESDIAYNHYSDHIFTRLGGAPSDPWFYIKYLEYMCGYLCYPLIIIGLGYFIFGKLGSKILTTVFLSMFSVVYIFFSLIVQTKVPGLIYPAYTILVILIAGGIISFFDICKNYSGEKNSRLLFKVMCIGMSCYLFRPDYVLNYRSPDNSERNVDIYNADIYRSINDLDLQKRVVLNIKDFEDVEFMFYNDLIGYRWYPDSIQLDSLKTAGHKFAAFKTHTLQQLPEYIENDNDIIIIDKELK